MRISPAVLATSISSMLLVPSLVSAVGLSPAPSIAQFLDGNGRANLAPPRASAYQGPLDLSGYRMDLDASDGAPRFLPEAADTLPGDFHYSDKFFGDGASSTVEAAAVYNGMIVFGGGFEAAGSLIASGIAGWDGARWVSLGSGGSGDPSNLVFALTVWNGSLIAGGQFQAMNGVPARNIARWDGTAWSAMGSGFTSQVFALGVWNGTLFAGGYLNTAGAAKWDGSQWTVPWPAMSGAVRSFATYNGDLIAGGDFLDIGGVKVGYVARWNGSLWRALGSGTNSSVLALTVFQNSLVAGGMFTQAGGMSANRVASWDGTQWHALGSGIPTGASTTRVWSLAGWGDDLYVGGQFTVAGGVPASNIARWTGSGWFPVGSGATGSTVVTSVDALLSLGDSLVMGGDFLSAGGVGSNNLASWNGSAWHAIGPGLGMSGGFVETMAEWNGLFVAGGSFLSAGEVPAAGIATFDGIAWHALGSGVGSGVFQFPGVYAIAVYNGDLIAGGAFTTAGGVSANRIARWNGTAWSPLGLGFDSSVLALAVYNGRLIAGGAFSTAGGVPASHLAQWDGANWTQLGGGVTGLYDAVEALAAFNGDLIVGGNLTAAGGQAMSHIARWDGTVWSPLQAGWTAPVNDLVVWNNLLYAAGSPSPADYGGGGVLAWDGASWLQLGDGLRRVDGSRPEILALAVYNGTLVATGNFDLAGGLPAAQLARWDGAAWSAMGSGTDAYYSPRSLGAHGGDLFVGGDFTIAGGRPSSFIGRWSDGVVTAPAPREKRALAPTLDAGPSPARRAITVRFVLPAPERVTCEVFDARGRRVAQLADGPAAAGTHALRWVPRDSRGRALPSGEYVVRLSAGARTLVKRIVRVS